MVNTAMLIQFGNPQLAAVPGHIGMIPCQPCQMRTVRTQTWCGVEIIAHCQYLDFSIAVQRHTDQHIGFFMFVVSMILTDTDQTMASMIDDQIGVAHVRCGREWCRLCSWCGTIQPLIVEVREVYGSIINHIISAAILMCTCSCIQWEWIYICHCPITLLAHNNVPTSLRWATLNPIGILTF